MQPIAAPKHVACHWAGVWSQNASGLGPSVWRVIGMVPEDWPAAVADGGHHLIDFPTYEQPVEEWPGALTNGRRLQGEPPSPPPPSMPPLDYHVLVPHTWTDGHIAAGVADASEIRANYEYKCEVKQSSVAGVWSMPAYSDGWTFDPTAPHGGWIVEGASRFGDEIFHSAVEDLLVTWGDFHEVEYGNESVTYAVGIGNCSTRTTSSSTTSATRRRSASSALRTPRTTVRSSPTCRRRRWPPTS